MKRDLEKAEALRKEAEAVDSHRRAMEKADAGNFSWSSGLSDDAWLSIIVGLGLLASAVAGGYVWWSRSQQTELDGALLLNVKREPDEPKGTIPVQPTKRRAA